MSRAESSASRRRRAATRRRALKRNYHAQATYGTNAGLWAHPYGAVAAEGLWAHVDRVGVRHFHYLFLWCIEGLSKG